MNLSRISSDLDVIVSQQMAEINKHFHIPAGLMKDVRINEPSAVSMLLAKNLQNKVFDSVRFVDTEA